MADEDRARHIAAIDQAVDATTHRGPGELIVGWVLLAATRSVEGGGAVLRIMSDATMPPWQVKGILAEAIDDVQFDQWSGDDDDGTGDAGGA